MGPIILDLIGLELSPEEREIIKHPKVGGLIFFSRNYESIAQFKELVSQIRTHSKQPLLLTVDQEGGRVQRFLSEFTSLPALGKMGQLYENNPDHAIQLAKIHGWVMASEILSLGIDLSFSPVLDLDSGLNQVIGDRSFHASPAIVTELARATIQGINNAGLCAVGKHFPGHGSVTADTHTHVTIDSRDYKTIKDKDLFPFAQLSHYLDGIMVSHIIYNSVDSRPCGFSPFWLQSILREELHFSGTIFTDDLSMQAVRNSGSITERARLALQAGCDAILICNHRKDATTVLDYLESSFQPNKFSNKCLQKLFPRRTLDRVMLQQTPEWRNSVFLLDKLNDK